ncbi:MAG: L-fucose/L-arabinose isomerase family protein [Candidatus Hodarchaeales archaeon]
MRQVVKIAVVCIARKTFDYKLAEELYQGQKKQLRSISEVNWVFVEELVFETEEAREVANRLVTEDLDGIIIIQGTFALGNLVLEIHKRVKCPMLFWFLEEPPYNGGKLRLNSLCGVNLNTSNLYKAGVKDYTVNMGEKMDPDWIDALRIRKAFSKAHIGLLGYRAQGFYNLGVDELSFYRSTGVLIEHYELEELNNIDCTEKEVERRRKEIENLFNVQELTEGKLDQLATLVVKLDKFIKIHDLSVLAIRCWPEFAQTFGIAPCAAMSIVQAEGSILACEGDIFGGLTMLMQKVIGGETPFLADLSQVNDKENNSLLWHCGVAPCNLWDGKCDRTLDTYFANGKGITAGFVLKEGEFTLARIDYALGEYRIFVQKGLALPMKKELKGTYLKARFETEAGKVFDKVIKNGIAHHFSIVYGQFSPAIELFAKLQGWTVIK